MQHQLGSCEGSISLQKDGEELHFETCEPATFSAWGETGREEASVVAFYAHSRCTVYKCPLSDFLITLDPSEMLYSSEGNSFHCFAV